MLCFRGGVIFPFLILYNLLTRQQLNTIKMKNKKLTQAGIIEGNTLIAEFMGFMFIADEDADENEEPGYYQCKRAATGFDCEIGLHLTRTLKPSDMLFHQNLEWIFDVLDRIESKLQFWTEIRSFKDGYRCTIGSDWTFTHTPEGNRFHLDRVTAIWLAVVDVLKTM